jgi:hypothetical protein
MAALSVNPEGAGYLGKCAKEIEMLISDRN